MQYHSCACTKNMSHRRTLGKTQGFFMNAQQGSSHSELNHILFFNCQRPLTGTVCVDDTLTPYQKPWGQSSLIHFSLFLSNVVLPESVLKLQLAPYACKGQARHVLLSAVKMWVSPGPSGVSSQKIAQEILVPEVKNLNATPSGGENKIKECKFAIFEQCPQTLP